MCSIYIQVPRMVTNGFSCERITSKAECEDAAILLGLSDTEASEEYVPDWPPYCYFYNYNNREKLYFNQNGNASSECNSYGRICLCMHNSTKCSKDFPCKRAKEIVMMTLYVKDYWFVDT